MESWYGPIESLVLCVLVCFGYMYSGIVLCSYLTEFFFFFVLFIFKVYCHEKSEIFCSEWIYFCSMKLAAIARTVGHLSKSADVMKIVNNLMKAPEMATTMQEFSKEMTKVILSLHLWTTICHSLYLQENYLTLYLVIFFWSSLFQHITVSFSFFFGCGLDGMLAYLWMLIILLSAQWGLTNIGLCKPLIFRPLTQFCPTWVGLWG